MKSARWRQLESLYNKAVEMDLGRREAFLREACGDDEDLLRDLVELLAEETEAASFLEKAAIQDLAHGFAATAALPDPSWIGRQIGNYEFVSLVGVGGMGEVYRAHDLKLKRDVAIKVLPDEFSRDPNRVSRFQREAQLLASLNHPNIAAIYGLEENDGIRFLVLEMVEGETLADRIHRGPIPIEEALKVALQIADALEAAHEKSVVHRDLKPANIKVTADGKVKVLDFGLAKALLADAGDPSNSPTASMAATKAGVILGTAAYMSPEQAKGQDVDRRTDIFAFGCVLYEMLTGLPAFQGTSVSEILASVLKTEPDWDRLPNDTPAAIRRLLRRCLRKDRKRRLQTIGDARIEIEEMGAEPEVGPAATRTAPHRRQVLKWIAAGAGVAAAGALGSSYVRKPADEPEMRAWEIVTPPTSDSRSFALSPDGRKLAYVVLEDKNESMLWLHSLVTGERRELPETEGATSPFWKPDSKSIAYFARGKLRRIDVGDVVGSPQTLADMPVLLSRGGAWSPNGYILFPRDAISALSRVQEMPGGTPEPATTFDPNHTRHSFPSFLPGGRQYLCFVAGTGVRGIYIGSMDSTKLQLVMTSETAGAYLPSGYLLFVSQGILVAQRFDLVTLKPSGATIQIGKVGFEGGLGAFSVSSISGSVAYRAPFAGRRQLKWYDQNGKPMGVCGMMNENRMASPAISPNGSKVAVETTDGIKILDPIPQPFNRGASPVWSRDGKWIAYSNDGSMWVKPTTEKGAEIQIVGAPEITYACDWHDESLLYFKVDSTTKRRSLWVQRIKDGQRNGEPQAFLNSNPDWDEFNGRFSPNGALVAYQSNQLKTLQINVVQSSGKALGLQVSTEGGIWPRWNHDGRELYYLSLDGVLMAVPITLKGSEVERGDPRELWRPRIVDLNVNLHTGYDVPLDGDHKGHFLINEPIEETVTPTISIIENWRPPTA